MWIPGIIIFFIVVAIASHLDRADNRMQEMQDKLDEVLGERDDSDYLA